MVKRFSVYLVDLDPTRGAEMRKTRPFVVISPNAMNKQLLTVLTAPLTSGRRKLPFRVAASFEGVAGEIALDQIRAVDKSRLIRQLGTLEEDAARAVCGTLDEMFAYE